MEVIQFAIEHQVVLLAFLFAFSELLALTPLKANSVFQLLFAVVKKAAKK